MVKNWFKIFIIFFFVFSMPLVNAEKVTTGTVNAELGLRIRTGPGTDYEKISLASYQSTITILSYENSGNGCEDKWIKIKTNDTFITGYVCSTYVKDIVEKELTEEEIKESIEKEKMQNSLSNDGIKMANMTDEEFDAYLNSQGFSEDYKVKLKELHKKHPSWIFKAVKSKYSWTDALNQQDQSGTSLMNVNTTYAQNGYEGYLSTALADYDHINNRFIPHDGTYWFQANRQTIAYYMDPRNFLDEKQIFMFEEMFYYPSYQTENIVKTTLSSDFLKQFSNLFMKAAEVSKVSPIYLASLAKQEVGTSNTNICTNGKAGYLEDGVNYSGYYNFYNIGASSSSNPKLKSLKYAKSAGWDSPEKAIVEGSTIISKNYVNCGQYTSYYQKFNLAPTATKGIWHQYTTNVTALVSPAKSTYNAYNSANLIEKDFVFSVPTFNGMPEKTTLPSLGNPNNWLKELKVNGSLVTNFDSDNLVYNVNIPYSESVNITAVPVVAAAKISGIGNIPLSQDNVSLKVEVTAQNGSVRTYTINISRTPKPVEQIKDETPQVTPPKEEKKEENIPKNDDKKSEEIVPAVPDNKVENNTPTIDLDNVLKASTYNYTTNYLSKVMLGTNVNTIITNMTKQYNTISVNIKDRSGNTKNQGTIVTGDKVTLSSGDKSKSLEVVIYGDVDGDGSITVTDLLFVQKHILGFTKLTGSYLTAADVNKDSKVNVVDILFIQKHLLSVNYISQG